MKAGYSLSLNFRFKILCLCSIERDIHSYSLCYDKPF